MMDQEKWVVVHSPAVGSTSVEGPFDTQDSAEVYAKLHHAKLEHWRVVKIDTPKK
jgi:hypothetical protein